MEPPPKDWERCLARETRRASDTLGVVNTTLGLSLTRLMLVTIPPDSFAELLSSNTPLLDVRAPIEFIRGALPAATNIPLLDDKQRKAVGTEYRRLGAAAATKLGHQLLAEETKRQRLADWKDFIDKNPGCALYCFRGGQRSQIAQQWLADQGFEIPRVEGGFKAIRQFLIDVITNTSEQGRFIVAGGKTGCGKTHLINGLSYSVDLEGRANHRGSAFGRRVAPQPSQIDFENALAIDFLKITALKPNQIFVEDESHSIGSIHLPPVLYEKMKQAPLAIIESTLSERTSVIFDDYIHSNYLDYLASSPEHGLTLFHKSLLGSLQKIQRRLGGDRFKEMQALMDAAMEHQIATGDASRHRDWIASLLVNYYDPMYDYQLSKKADRIVFRGNKAEFLSWAKHIDLSKT